jgi:beta-N-acetylhexosaminidase
MTNLPGRKHVAGGKIVNVFGLNGPSAQLFSQILGIGGKKVMVVSLGSPYLILHYPIIQNYLCTFSTSSTSERAAVKALFGEIRNHARLPITLPGVADRGFAMEWPTVASNIQQKRTPQAQ